MKVAYPLALATVAFLSSGIHAEAAVIYDNQATFISTLQPGYYLETFQSTSPPNYSSNGFSYTLSSNGALYHSSSISANPGSFLTITFTSGNVMAVGGDFFSKQVDFLPGPAVVSLSDGTQAFYSPDFSSSRFLGFVSEDSFITSLTVEALGAFDSANLDNVIVGTTVPEPSAALLLGLGAWGVVARRRRECCG